MSISVSFKHFGTERGEDIGEVLIIDRDLLDRDPVLAENMESGPSGPSTLIPAGYTPQGLTEMGYMSRRDAEALAKQHGVPLSEH